LEISRQYPEQRSGVKKRNPSSCVQITNCRLQIANYWKRPISKIREARQKERQKNAKARQKHAKSTPARQEHAKGMACYFLVGNVKARQKHASTPKNE